MERSFFKALKEQARKNPKKIVFPETEDARILEAVQMIKAEGIAEPILLAEDSLGQCEKDIFAVSLFERHQENGMTYEQAGILMEDKLFYSAMLVRFGLADGFIAGAVRTTASVMRAVIKCLDVDPRIGLVTSCFLMRIPNCTYGEEGSFVFADCAVIPSPTSEQLCKIAIASALFVKEVLGRHARVAMLSFSSRGSANHERVEKVRESVRMARQWPGKFFDIDGEIQVDSAIIPEIAARKLEHSDIQGKANILIFPDLDSGNIAYKLTERLAGAKAIGPNILGTVQPCSDLSRGCSVEDIVYSTAITVVRAQSRETLNPDTIGIERCYENTRI